LQPKKENMANIGIFYGGKDNGSTARIAKQIQQGFGEEIAAIHNVHSAKKETLLQHDFLIFGTAAWGIGEMHSDWENFIEEIVETDMGNRKIALFGLGDQVEYPESFVDGMGSIFCRLPEKDKIVGFTSIRGYSYYFSTAEIDGKFVGLAIDEDSQHQLTEERIQKWVSQLKEEFGI
jgi:flavodoxin I